MLDTLIRVCLVAFLLVWTAIPLAILLGGHWRRQEKERQRREREPWRESLDDDED